MDNTSIVIRTLVLAGGRVYLQVGGAVVADSDPDAEYAETLDKARAGTCTVFIDRVGNRLTIASATAMVHAATERPGDAPT